MPVTDNWPEKVAPNSCERCGREVRIRWRGNLCTDCYLNLVEDEERQDGDEEE